MGRVRWLGHLHAPAYQLEHAPLEVTPQGKDVLRAWHAECRKAWADRDRPAAFGPGAFSALWHLTALAGGPCQWAVGAHRMAHSKRVTGELGTALLTQVWTPAVPGGPQPPTCPVKHQGLDVRMGEAAPRAGPLLLSSNGTHLSLESRSRSRNACR